MNRRGMRAFWPVVALLLACAPAARAETFRDWALLTPEQGPCLLHQKVIATAAGLPIADVFAAPVANGGLRLSVLVPLGAALAEPMAYRVPGAARAVPLVWQNCNTESCLAQVEVDPAERARLAAGLLVEVGFVPVIGARPMRFELSLLGLTAGLAAAERCSDR